MKKIFKILAIFAMLSILFAGCSQSTNSSYVNSIDSGTISNSSDSAETQTENETEYTTVTFNGIDYPVNSSLDFDVVDVEYEENTDENITYIWFYSIDCL